MTIDNPDDFCSFKGKDIDFEDEKYDPFPVYRFKPVAMNMLKHCIVPSRLDNLVANLAAAPRTNSAAASQNKVFLRISEKIFAKIQKIPTFAAG